MADPCVTAILCPLPNAVLSALKGIITGQIAVLTAQRANVVATLAALEIQLIPLQAANTLVQSAIGTVRAAGNLVPVTLLQNCTDLGDMMVDLNASLDADAAAATRVLGDLNRTLSYQAELEARLDTIDAAIAHFEDITLALEVCP